jgi:hypothetical protein
MDQLNMKRLQLEREYHLRLGQLIGEHLGVCGAAETDELHEDSLLALPVLAATPPPPEPPRGNGWRKGKKCPRSPVIKTKQQYGGVSKSMFMHGDSDPHVTAMRAHYELARQAVVEVTIDQDLYVKTLEAMQANITRIREDAPAVILRIRNHAFKPRQKTMQLPVLKMPAKGGIRDHQCICCNRLITDEYVPSLICLRAKAHVHCAAVVTDAVSKRQFFACLAGLCNFNLTPRKLEPLTNPRRCKHRCVGTSVLVEEYKEVMDELC